MTTGIENTGGSAMDRAIAAHRQAGREPEFIARAPGRVNLIGEHTDYNEGFVFPMAIPFDTAMAVSTAAVGASTKARSEGFGSVVLDANDTEIDTGHWSVHLRGVHQLMTAAGVDPGPFGVSIATDIPTGASLSSSASVEVALISAMLHLAGETWDSVEVARLAQRVENEVVGLPSGIMDQLISTAAHKDHASLIDCRSLEMTPFPLPDGFSIAVMDTKTRRQLVDSAFADRRDTCVRAAEMMGLSSLREATMADISRLPSSADLERRRAGHVVSENARTLAAARAMEANDARTLGRLMSESHHSLRYDYEVSGEALDQIVAVAEQSPGCLGSRLTGGGFAGCAIALVSAPEIDSFLASVDTGFREISGQSPTIWICAPAAGASVTDTPPS